MKSSPKNWLLLFLLLTLVFQGGLSSQAGSPGSIQKPKPGLTEAWYQTTKMLVKVTLAGQKNAYAAYDFQKNQQGDLRVEVWEKKGEEKNEGTILVIEGQVMLAKGIQIESGYEIDALDGPVLNVKLAMALLSKAFPQGPASIGTFKTTALTERKNELTVKTPGSSLAIPPPWNLKGAATTIPSGQGNIKFDCSLTFSSRETGTRETMQIEGVWFNNARELALPSDMSLQGWNFFSLGPTQLKTSNGGTITDFKANPLEEFPTLGNLRKSLPHEAPPKK